MYKFAVRVVGDAVGQVIIEADDMSTIRNCIYFYKTNEKGQSYIAHIYPAPITIVKRLIS